jgi:hypothetical protein
VNALDKDHFHQLFTSIRIKDNESATSYLRRFAYAKTEAEGDNNVYSEQQLVSFVLSGLSSAKNMKYETAIQLYNLEKENGKTFTLEAIEKKFFAINEKIARDQALTRLALGSAARSRYDYEPKRGIGKGYGSGRGHGRSSSSTQCTSYHNRKPEHANAAASSSTSRPIVCYNCSEPGHITPKCNKPRQAKDPLTRATARGNAARSSSKSSDSDNNTNPAIACSARAFQLEHAVSARRIIEYYVHEGRQRPVPPGIPILDISYDGSELLNTQCYVSITVPFDHNHFNPMLENHIVNNRIPLEYLGRLDPLSDGVWIMVHDYPLGDQDRTFAAIVDPEQQHDRILTEGITPLLENHFAFFPDDLPNCFTRWYNLIQACIQRRIINISEDLPVTVTSRNMTISVTFYPLAHERPILVREGDSIYIVPEQNSPGNVIETKDEENTFMEEAFSAMTNTSASALAVRRSDPSIAEIGDPCNLNNYLPDSGATQHMTSHSADLTNVVEGQIWALRWPMATL